MQQANAEPKLQPQHNAAPQAKIEPPVVTYTDSHAVANQQPCPPSKASRFDLLVFSDLDGSLLDEGGRPPKANRELLERLEQQSIPVIFTSSKTREEILHIQRQLNIHQAFIPENGGGFYIPRGHPLAQTLALSPWGTGYGMLFGARYSYIKSVYSKIKEEYGIKGISDMGGEEISALTGLDHCSVHRALQREFSEPFIFLGTPQVAALSEALSTYGLAMTRGGIFYHIMSAAQDKGRAVSTAIQLFRLAYQSEPTTIALGDAENDASMLNAVDIPILLRRGDGSYAEVNIRNLRKSLLPGSKGWGEQLQLALHQIALDKPRHTTDEQP